MLDDLYYADPAQPLTTADEELLDDLSVDTYIMICLPERSKHSERDNTIFVFEPYLATVSEVKTNLWRVKIFVRN